MACRAFLRVVTNVGKWIPVIFVLAISVFSFYAYNVIFLLGYKDDLSTRIIFGVFFNLIFILFLWSYLKTVFTPRRRPPDQFKLPNELRNVIESQGIDGPFAVDQLRKFAHENGLPVKTCDYRTGYVRYCQKCGSVKPDRASHCSVCDQCILKYDHHCIWVNNCVNYCNYKFFVLFLLYGFLLCLYGSLTILPNFIDLINHRNVRRGEIQIIIIFFFAGMFGISLVALLGFHIYLLGTNQSTVEFARPPILECGPFKKAYDLGIKKNFKQVFGNDIWKWPLPVESSLGTGFEFCFSPYCYTACYSGERMAMTSNNPVSNGHSRDDPRLKIDV